MQMQNEHSPAYHSWLPAIDIHFGTDRTYLENGTSPENAGGSVGFLPNTMWLEFFF